MNTEENRKRILVVEDEPAIGEVCWEILTDEGFEVELASNGKVARTKVESQDYDVILLDIRMPEENGTDFCRWFVHTHPHLEKTVAFTSGDTLGRETSVTVDTSIRPFLPKPFTPDELRAFVHKVLDEGRR
jgi:DNA-binding response OmpR family regulator